MLAVLTILCGRSHVRECNARVRVRYRSMRRSRGRVREVLPVGETAWTRLRWRRRVESSRVESLSFRNPKQKIHLGSSILWRLTLSGRTISIVRSVSYLEHIRTRSWESCVVFFEFFFYDRKGGLKIR